MSATPRGVAERDRSGDVDRQVGGARRLILIRPLRLRYRSGFA